MAAGTILLQTGGFSDKNLYAILETDGKKVSDETDERGTYVRRNSSTDEARKKSRHGKKCVGRPKMLYQIGMKNKITGRINL